MYGFILLSDGFFPVLLLFPFIWICSLCLVASAPRFAACLPEALLLWALWRCSVNAVCATWKAETCQ